MELNMEADRLIFDGYALGAEGRIYQHLFSTHAAMHFQQDLKRPQNYSFYYSLCILVFVICVG